MKTIYGENPPTSDKPEKKYQTCRTGSIQKMMWTLIFLTTLLQNVRSADFCSAYCDKDDDACDTVDITGCKKCRGPFTTPASTPGTCEFDNTRTDWMVLAES